MIMKGGNTDELYNKTDKRLEFAKSLKEQHPELVEIVWKYNRWHHQVNYLPFRKNKLIKKKGLIILDRVNNYGMVLREIGGGSLDTSGRTLSITEGEHTGGETRPQ